MDMSVLKAEVQPPESAMRDMPKGYPAGPTTEESPKGVELPKLKFEDPPEEVVYE